MRSNLSTRPVSGYGLFKYRDHLGRQACGFLDGSPVLVPTKVERTPDGRRLRFAEGARELQQLGDIFCANSEVAGLVREALNEKFERQRAEANAFRITSAKISRRQAYLFLHAELTGIRTGVTDTVSFTLEAPDYKLQREGRREFEHFIEALGLGSCDDTDQLVGRTATFESASEDRVFKRWAA